MHQPCTQHTHTHYACKIYGMACIIITLFIIAVILSDKGPIRTSVIVAPATSPKQQEIIEVVDTQDTPVNTSTSLHPSQLTAQSLVSRSPSSTPVTMKQTVQPLQAGNAEHQPNPTSKNPEQVIQLDKQSWDQLPPLYKYMIQMRVIEEQQQLQMAAQQMQGQQRQQQQQQPPKPSLPQQLPQQPPVSQLQPNFLQNLALQTQMFNMFQAQLANPNLLPQLAAKFPLVATTATIPMVTTTGVIPSFPPNFMVTGATSASTTVQEATTATSTSNVSMETSSTASEPSTSVASGNSKSQGNQKLDKISNTTNYRTNQTPDSPDETPSDDNSGKTAGIEPFISTACCFYVS